MPSVEKGHQESTIVYAVIAVVVVGLALFVTAAAFFPLFVGNYNHGTRKAACESNLKQIGNAFKMYLGDWDDTYPVNLQWQHIEKGAKHASPDWRVQLSDDAWIEKGKIDQPGRMTGPNWVEALYRYIEASSAEDALSVWKCPKADDAVFPEDSKTAHVTYSMNINMCGVGEKRLTEPGATFLLREWDRQIDAVCTPERAINGQDDKIDAKILAKTFLTDYNPWFTHGKPQARLHGSGSMLLFADSHVKPVRAEVFDSKPVYDPKNKLWWLEAGGQKGVAINAW
jgi:prepilin-type processing-associated H-X9-DG protein